MTTDAKVIVDQLSAVTGAPFVVAEPGRSRLVLQRKAKWFVSFADLAYVEQTRYLSAAWGDDHGAIWLESSEIADMIALVEREYGEKGAASMPDVKPGIPPPDRTPKEVIGFPRVVKLLRVYDEIVARLSKEHGVELRMLYDGGVGVTTVRIGAKIGSPSSDLQTLTQQTGSTAKALKEAYDCVLEVKS
jgi:hypothetical protein